MLDRFLFQKSCINICTYFFLYVFGAILQSYWEAVSGCAAAAAKLLQSCLTLCDPIDGSPLGSPVPGILQARTLEWVAISFSHAWKWKVKVKSLSRVQLFATLWTAAHQAPPSMGFSRQEYWSGVPSPSPSQAVVLSKNPWIKEIYNSLCIFKLTPAKRTKREGEQNCSSSQQSSIYRCFCFSCNGYLF